MPTKRVIKQKQKQRQSVVVNVNLAKARARASAKKSGKKGGGGGRGSIMMLPPPIYASPIDRLIPAMYGSQGQQIRQQSTDDLLRNFLSNQQNQQTNAGFRSLGGEPQLRSTSSFIPYDDSSDKSFKSLGSLSSLSSLSSYPGSKSSLSRNYLDDISEITDPTYMSEDSSISKLMSTESQYNRALASPFSEDLPIPFQNEERSYLRAAEPDYEQNIPIFSDTPQESIAEIIRRPQRRPPVRLNLDEESILTGTPASRASGTPASKVNIIPFEDEMSSDSLSNYSRDSLNTNPFPKNVYNKMMG